VGGELAQVVDRRRAASIGAWAGWAAAVFWFAFGVESIVRPGQANYRDALWFVPFGLTVVTFRYVHAVQRSSSRPAERTSFALLMATMAIVMAGNVGVLTDQPLLSIFAFPLGAILWIVTMLAFGIATWRAAVLPRYAAWAIILLEPGSILTGLALTPIAPVQPRGSYTAGIEKGLAVGLVALGLHAWLRRGDAAPANR
jgi:hypothetical protein